MKEPMRKLVCQTGLTQNADYLLNNDQLESFLFETRSSIELSSVIVSIGFDQFELKIRNYSSPEIEHFLNNYTFKKAKVIGF